MDENAMLSSSLPVVLSDSSDITVNVDTIEVSSLISSCSMYLENRLRRESLRLDALTDSAVSNEWGTK